MHITCVSGLSQKLCRDVSAIGNKSSFVRVSFVYRVIRKSLQDF